MGNVWSYFQLQIFSTKSLISASHPTPYPNLQQKRIMSMEKGEKAQPYIKRQESKQTNKLADETEQVINPLINFSLSPIQSPSVCKPLKSCHMQPNSKAGPIWSKVCFCLSPALLSLLCFCPACLLGSAPRSASLQAFIKYAPSTKPAANLHWSLGPAHMQIHICSSSKRRFTGITPHTGVSPSPQNQSQTHTRKRNQPRSLRPLTPKDKPSSYAHTFPNTLPFTSLANKPPSAHWAY